MPKLIACSDCFNDYGLRQEADRHGKRYNKPCVRCKSITGRKLDVEAIEELAMGFFIGGSVVRSQYGQYQQIESNPYHFGTDSGVFLPGLTTDAQVIGDILKTGFFLYGPPAWRFGEVYPLKKLNHKQQRGKVIEKILQTYPDRTIGANDVFFRLRKNLTNSYETAEYDAAPEGASFARFNNDGSSILYGSQSLEICLHECRATINDELYVAVLRPQADLICLDLTHFELEEDGTMFDSLALAVDYLLSAADHSYPALTAIALAARTKGYNGIIFPSYFSRIKLDTIPNLGIFGRPVHEGLVAVEGINRVHMSDVTYKVSFGPVIKG